MRMHKVFLPVLATMAIGLAGVAGTGCHVEGEAKIGGATPPPPPPPPPAPPPPASTTAEAPPPPPPPPPQKKVIALKGVQMKSANKIDMPGTIEYQTGSSKLLLNDSTKKVLTQLVQIMKDNKEITKLRIEGNTDNEGEDKGFDNVKLSQQRAASIAEYLTKNGVEAARLTTVGFGSSHPLAPNDTKENKAKNRYTDFVVQEFNGESAEEAAPPQGTAPVGAAAAAAPAPAGSAAATAPAAAKDTAATAKKPATPAPADTAKKPATPAPASSK